MNRASLLLLLGAGALLSGLTGCGPRPQPDNSQGQPAAPSSAASNAPTHSPAAALPAATTAAPGVRNVLSKSGVELVLVPAGEFQMGAADGNPDEAPPHQVRLPAFLIDRHEVSHAQFAAVQLPDPSRWQSNPRGPVERVRWRDAKQYCNERSLLEGLKPCYNEKTPDWDCDFSADGYRLPTEAEWEYAARAGTTGAYDFGAAEQLKQFGWFAGNSEQKTHPAGQRKANRWGIHDLYGNVSEWCEDVYDPAYYAASPSEDPRGPKAAAGRDLKRVIRGGNWKVGAESCRVSFRQGEKTGDSDACFSTDYCGFRCVRRPAAAELQQWIGGVAP